MMPEKTITSEKTITEAEYSKIKKFVLEYLDENFDLHDALYLDWEMSELVFSIFDSLKKYSSQINV